MAEIINSAKNCNVRTYMAAGLDGNLKVLLISGDATEQELQEAFDAIQEEYMDLAGLQKSGEFELLKSIKYLHLRLESIYQFIKIHRACIANIGEPFHPAIQDLKKFGHRLFWNKDMPDILDFLKQLNKIALKEKRTEAELAGKMRELEVLESRQNGPTVTDRARRLSFLSMLNNLGKFGYVVDKDKTTIEELGLMVKEYLDTLESQLQDKKKK